MKKRIVKNNLVITVLACALAVCTCVIIYTLYMQQTMYEQVQSQTRLLMHILETTPEDDFDILYDVEGLSQGRVTYIYRNGLVTYDSKFDVSTMDSHADRPEVEQALNEGMATTQRYSMTSRQVTYYCAAKVGDGSVVRIAVTTNDILMDILKDTSPLVIFSIACTITMCFIFSGITTMRIVDHIETYDIENGEGELYEELEPFMNKIRRQNEIINRQIQDITEEKLKLQSIFNNVKEGIIVCNSNSEIIQINPEALELFEIDNGIGDFDELINIPEMHTALEGALSGHTRQVVFSVRDNWFQCVAGPNIYLGDHGAVVIVMDITGQVENERNRRRFTDSVTHELKTPLTNILGYSQLISTDIARKEDIKEFGRIIERNAEILLDMIDNIIRISGLETDEKMNIETVQLDEVLCDVLDTQAPAAHRKNITINSNIETVQLDADMGMMYGLVDNLVSNAIKYNKNGGSISIMLREDGSNAQLCVEDSGIGIPAKDLDSIFERFYVVDKSRNKNISSTGLGLSIVKHIVKLHKGNVSVKSTEGKGSLFTVTLPLKLK